MSAHFAEMDGHLAAVDRRFAEMGSGFTGRQGQSGRVGLLSGEVRWQSEKHGIKDCKEDAHDVFIL